VRQPSQYPIKELQLSTWSSINIEEKTLKRRDYWEEQGVDGEITLKWISG
jgi:hypothetical protein